jgi:ubiquinone/menaquinone biosynthesis C-methylase UbiE
VVVTRSWSADTLRDLLTPPRIRGYEILDSPDIDPQIVKRSLADVARANAWFGGISSALDELKDALKQVPRDATLLDVGTGLGDIPCRAREEARRNGVELTTIGLDAAAELAEASKCSVDFAVCADARHLPFADNSVDIVMCSQVLHHFAGTEAAAVLREMDRVARVSRHDGVVSVMRGFTPAELADTVQEAIARRPVAHRRRAFRVTTSWAPVHR